MSKLVLLFFSLTSVGVAFADPATPAEHPEKDLRAIGGGFFLERKDALTADENGNTIVLIYSHTPISAGARYSIDLSPLAGAILGVGTGRLGIDAGPLGFLRMQAITIDCAHRTYEAFDARKALPLPIWRPASTLPALSPVFQYVCAHLTPATPTSPDDE